VRYDRQRRYRLRREIKKIRMSSCIKLAPELKCPHVAVPKDMRDRPMSRGFFVPWFVRWFHGEPEFRVMDTDHFLAAIRHRLCWTCGKPLTNAATCFVVGPMCAVNRVSGEPPSHAACARYAAQACPFLSRPQATRRPLTEDPETGGEPHENAMGGVIIKRNPGVTLLWFARGYTLEHVPNGVVFRMGTPVGVEWYAEGRRATRAECEASIAGGLPTLREYAQKDGEQALARMERDLAKAMQLLPKG
jgi:hypothetical protein